jgi:hypothetical protein
LHAVTVPADRPSGLPEVARVAGRIRSTLLPWAGRSPSADDVEQVSLRIASGLDGLYLRAHQALQDRVEELELPDPDLEDLRTGVTDLFADIRAWHHEQADHQGWPICQHPICRAVREFPWE